MNLPFCQNEHGSQIVDWTCSCNMNQSTCNCPRSWMDDGCRARAHPAGAAPPPSVAPTPDAPPLSTLKAWLFALWWVIRDGGPVQALFRQDDIVHLGVFGCNLCMDTGSQPSCLVACLYNFHEWTGDPGCVLFARMDQWVVITHVSIWWAYHRL
jgi:hypothetical protein